MADEKIPLLQCYHLGDITESPKVQKLVNTGELRNSIGKGKICDWRVPVDQGDVVEEQDVSCVGPEDPRCPDPKSASFILVDQIRTR